MTRNVARHLLFLEEMVERRDQFARGQIAARAEDDDGAGSAGLRESNTDDAPDA